MSQNLEIKRLSFLICCVSVLQTPKYFFSYFGKSTLEMCLLNPIPDHSVLIAQGYQEEEKVNSVFQIVGGLQ